MRLSIFPASGSNGFAPHDGTAQSNNSSSSRPSNTSNDPKYRRLSSSSKEPRSAGPRGQWPRGSGNTGGYVSDSSKQSTETDEAVVALRRAGGYDLPEGLQGAGLLFVRCDRYWPNSCTYVERFVVLEGLGSRHSLGALTGPRSMLPQIISRYRTLTATAVSML